MIIDTNVYSNLRKGHKDLESILAAQKLIYLPTIVVAELKFGFLLGTKNNENLAELYAFASRDQVILLDSDMGTTDEYSKLAYHCRRHGKTLTHNDIWLAALAKQHNLTLLTCDNDFLGIKEPLGKLLVVVS